MVDGPPTALNDAATAIASATLAASHPASQAIGMLASATTTALAAAATSALSTAADDKPSGGQGECRLLGPFALLVQLALGGLALMSLVYKRWRERPQRPVKIWFFDASKQVFGSVLVHMANVFMSMLTSGRFSVKLEPTNVQTVARLLRRDEDPYVPNPCSLYLLNLAIDTTVGIPILIILLRVITGLASYTPFGQPAESIQSGYYGRPPNALWWLKQSLIYFCGLFGMKICVLILFLVLPWISHIGDWALGWTEGNERLQIVFVMMLFPLIMNAMQYYIIDGFIKKQESDHERLPTEDPDHDRRSPFDDAPADSDDDVASGSENSDDVRLSRSQEFKRTQESKRSEARGAQGQQ
ncbi:FK506-binding protein 2 precursor [Apiospora kogelbergensis]|uniref:FK506-binding protein 2 precursor n=1 Tax=Apiospora kogelbergensis TaxID=1337665 RepID=UPI00312FE08F